MTNESRNVGNIWCPAGCLYVSPGGGRTAGGRGTDLTSTHCTALLQQQRCVFYYALSRIFNLDWTHLFISRPSKNWVEKKKAGLHCIKRFSCYDGFIVNISNNHKCTLFVFLAFWILFIHMRHMVNHIKKNMT